VQSHLIQAPAGCPLASGRSSGIGVQASSCEKTSKEFLDGHLDYSEPFWSEMPDWALCGMFLCLRLSFYREAVANALASRWWVRLGMARRLRSLLYPGFKSRRMHYSFSLKLQARSPSYWYATEELDHESKWNLWGSRRRHRCGRKGGVVHSSQRPRFLHDGFDHLNPLLWRKPWLAMQVERQGYLVGCE
jgi:hypothetical protein